MNYWLEKAALESTQKEAKNMTGWTCYVVNGRGVRSTGDTVDYDGLVSWMLLEKSPVFGPMVPRSPHGYKITYYIDGGVTGTVSKGEGIRLLEGMIFRIYESKPTCETKEFAERIAVVEVG